MPELESPTECVLTLAEAAVFLRVSDKALADMATAGEVPARLIGGAWRLLRQALVKCDLHGLIRCGRYP